MLDDGDEGEKCEDSLEIFENLEVDGPEHELGEKVGKDETKEWEEGEGLAELMCSVVLVELLLVCFLLLILESLSSSFFSFLNLFRSSLAFLLFVSRFSHFCSNL